MTQPRRPPLFAFTASPPRHTSPSAYLCNGLTASFITLHERGEAANMPRYEDVLHGARASAIMFRTSGDSSSSGSGSALWLLLYARRLGRGEHFVMESTSVAPFASTLGRDTPPAEAETCKINHARSALLSRAL